MFERKLVERFERCHVSSVGEVWVQRGDALAALQLAEELGRTLLGMEGFIVGASGVYPSLGRVADFSGLPDARPTHGRVPYWLMTGPNRPMTFTPTPRATT
jgi:hypothetical protein